MDTNYIILINCFIILLSVIAVWKIPLAGVFGVLISVTVLFYEIINGNITDIGVRMFTILSVVISTMGTIGGFSRNR